MKNYLATLILISVSICLNGQDVRSDLKAIIDIVKKAEKPYTSSTKEALNQALEKFDADWMEKSDDEKVLKAIVDTYIFRLDTSLFSEETASKSAEKLVRFVENAQLNGSAMLLMRVVGRFATNQPPVHSARVKVIEALSSDYLEERPPKTFDELSNSGYGLLPFIYKANGQLDKALGVYKDYLQIIEENEMYVSKANLYMDLIRMEMDAKRYRDAQQSIASYRQRFLMDSYSSSSLDLAILEASTFTKQGNREQAIVVLSQEQERLEGYGDQLGEEMISLQFELLSESIRYSVSENLGVEEPYLDRLIAHVKSNQSFWKYGQLYFRTEDLLKELGAIERLSELQKPE